MKQQLPLSAIHIDDPYWNRYTRLISARVIPYQWEILNDRVKDAPPSHCLHNFRIAAGEEKGEHGGTVFQDSDAAKWLEAVAYSLAASPDPELEKTADSVIDLIGKAQESDGYLNTYYSLVDRQGRWKHLTDGHELYCAGHFIEAAVAYYECTGKDKFLGIMRRFADLIAKVFGPKDNQIHGYPGHPEIELALVRLYRATGEKSYLDLAKYFVDTRGTEPNYFLAERKQPGYQPLFSDFEKYDPAYSQSHLPVREQESAEGHAVRAVYLYCAMADLAEEYKDEALLKQCKILWNNMIQKRMYITGSIGSSGFWERFTIDYDLPNDSNYSETCASIGLARFGLRMAKYTEDASYIDTVERALYNTVRAGISLEGDRYFYVNPLEVWPEACMDLTSRAHIKPVRQPWFDVACCPTNMARTFTSLGQYLYFAGSDGLFVNLFIQNDTVFELQGKQIALSIKTDYPRSGKVKFLLKGAGAEFSLHIRVPAFADDFVVLVNGKNAESTGKEQTNGYYTIRRRWDNDEVDAAFSIKPRIIYANTRVHQNCGKIAIARGPEIYCLEEADNGRELSSVYVDPQVPLEEEWQGDLLGGTMVIKGKGKKLVSPAGTGSFSETLKPSFEDIEFTAIPYGSWCNRRAGEMIVWLHALL